ncbi:MAG: cyclic nucleotide-binding domain-containing protein [Bacteroidales bacterium]|nr:cyclic nucleotide-binding domain-containing protein [Bacteroidales bacterium]
MLNQSDSETTQRVQILRSILLFKEVSEPVLEKMAQGLVVKKLLADDVLFSCGDSDYALYIVVAGKVKAHVGDHVFATFSSLQYFGEYSLLDSSVRSTTVTALEPTQLLRLDQQLFFNFLDSIPSLSRAMLKGLVWRLRDYNILEAELTRKNLEIRIQKEELEVQRKELESLNQTKDKFFAIIAHDLRNPFSTVLNLSELLAKEFDSFEPDKMQLFIEQIYKYSNNTFNLLENLLQWSLLQTGRTVLKAKQGNIADLINENIELLRGNALQKNINLRWSNPMACHAFYDQNMINTVIRNLITNAIKFTPPNGDIVVEVSDGTDSFTIAVCDNGVGISEDDQSNLFRIDTNPSTIGTSQEPGTGLGLILCKEFVEKNGGAIGLHSQLGKGSKFYFTVPKHERIP